MSSESSGTEYLRRLKQDLEHSAGLASQGTGIVPPEVPAGAHERRQSPRYKCEGSAEFRVGGSDIRTWGTFTDICLRGC
jgi:hypothetical protein